MAAPKLIGILLCRDLSKNRENGVEADKWPSEVLELRLDLMLRLTLLFMKDELFMKTSDKCADRLKVPL